MTSSPPSIAIAGISGYVGKQLLPPFVSAVQDGLISRLVLLTRDKTKVAAQPAGVEVAETTYESESLEKTLKGIDILINVLGTAGEEVGGVKTRLIEAAAKSGVKIYVPSEFGTDHTGIGHIHPMFQAKQDHFAKAESLGLKAIAIFNSLFQDITFCKWFGFDSAEATYTITGDGKTPFAITSLQDLGPVTLHTTLLAYNEPEKVPRAVRVASNNRTPLEYARAFEAVRGDELKKEYVTLEEAKAKYEEQKKFLPPDTLGPLLNILIADGTFDFTENHNELINPGESKFKWDRIEEYAKRVNGRPWDHGTVPFGN